MNVEEAIDGKEYTTWEEVRAALSRVEERRQNGEDVILRLVEVSSKRALSIALLNEEGLEKYLNSLSRRSMMFADAEEKERLTTTVTATIVSAEYYLGL